MDDSNTVWKLMNDYKFVVDPDTINDDMSCIICKDLMIDACHSVCGCQYCRKCITEYVGRGDKFCPGNKSKCKEEYISLAHDVFSDKRMNNKIFKSKVVCPNDSCDAKIELRHMHEHLVGCKERSTECPYVTIGCNNREQTKDYILVHLNNETLPHIRLMLDYILNLKNEIDGMKLEIRSLKEDLRMKDMKIEEIIELTGEMNEEIINLMNKVGSMGSSTLSGKQLPEIYQQMNEQKRETKEQITNLKKEIDSVKQNSKKQISEMIQPLDKEKKYMNEQLVNLKKEMESVKQTAKKQMSEMVQQMDKQNGELTNLKREMKSVKEESIKKENRIATLETQLKEVRNGNESRLSVTIERETEGGIFGWMKSRNKEMNEKESEVNSKRETINEREKRMKDGITSFNFIWKINEWTKKSESMKGKYIHSESFYSKNYKLCLRLRIIGDGNIWLGCVIMKGDNDDFVRWPMNYDVILSILNKDTLEAHKSVTLKYDTYECDPYKQDTYYHKNAFDRPKNEMNNYGIGTNELIKYSSIKDNPSIICDDSIVVSCILTDPGLC